MKNVLKKELEVELKEATYKSRLYEKMLNNVTMFLHVHGFDMQKIREQAEDELIEELGIKQDSEEGQSKFKSEIEKTEWARKFKEDDSLCYDRAIELASREIVEVEIYSNDELGYFVWSVSSVEDREFWFDTFRTKREAVSFCKRMGWKVVEAKKE